MKSPFDAGWPPSLTSSPCACAASRTLATRSRPSPEDPSGVGKASTTAVPSACHDGPAGATAPWMPSTWPTARATAPGEAPRTRASCGRGGPEGARAARPVGGRGGAGADARLLERHEPVLGVALLGDRVDVGDAGLEADGR